MERTQGVVKWFSAKKGYGFITHDEHDEVFVHFSQIQMEGYKKLRRGDTVEFQIKETDKGPQAFEVTSQ